MMFPYAIYYILMGIAQWPEYFTRINVSDGTDSKAYMNNFQANQQFVTAALMLVLGFVQYFFFTMDPTDSNYIIYEQSMNLSSLFSLPQVKNVMHKE